MIHRNKDISDRVAEMIADRFQDGFCDPSMIRGFAETIRKYMGGTITSLRVDVDERDKELVTIQKDLRQTKDELKRANAESVAIKTSQPNRELRNQFAGLAMQSLIAKYGSVHQITDLAYRYADAMMESAIIPDEPSVVKNDSSIKSLEFTVRTQNCLLAESITTVGRLLNCSRFDLLRMNGLGKKSLAEIKERLAKENLSLYLNKQVA